MDTSPVMDLLDRITQNPKVMGGKPCLRGKRVTVGAITGLLASGYQQEEILRLYPYLEADDIKAALKYVTRLVEGELVTGHLQPA